MTPVRVFACCALAAALSACSVGPPYVAPQPPETNAYTAGPAPSLPEQQLQPGASVAPHWWDGFGSPALDRLETQALARNPGIESAQHTLAQAHYNLVAAEGLFYPQVALAASGERTRSSGAESGGHIGPNQFNLYTGQVTVSYYPDAFGLNRLVADDSRAQVDVAHDQLLAAQLTIEGNVASTVFALASLEARIAATRQTVADQQEILDLVRTQYSAGAVSGLQVATQESQLASAQAQLPALELARDQARHLLATYLGEPPAQAADLEAPQLAELELPSALPLSVPASLVHQRPDILAAEAQLRAANARVGEAVARMYPNLVLTGDFGAQSNTWGKFLDPASRIWDLAAAALAPVFTGGTLKAQKQAAQEAYHALFANYRSTVLAAFRDVADALRALEHDASALEAQKRALDAADTAFGLARSQYQAGAVGYLGLLVSEIQLQNARIAYVGAEAQRFADSAALYVALGGGVVAPDATREEK